jgi:hypothetical protein
MTNLRLAPDLTLPLEAITETIAILGIRGSGKTNTAAVYAEELLRAGQQVVILDPTDAWWGLKSSADGEQKGYPVVVLGGKHQDLPLASGDGKLVADFVVEQGASVICCLRGFESKTQELAFTTAFLRRLYHLKGQQDAPTPLALIIDEASRLVPQRVMGEEAACVGAVQQIVRQGRSSGFGVVLIDQRAATVNKDVLSMLEMLIVHRTTGPQDRKALREWVQQHDTEGREATFLNSLASLKLGEAWVWSPGWLDLFRKVQMRGRATFDSSRTPKAGERVVTPKAIATVDLDALRAKLAVTLEKAKADDPKELRKTIAERDARIRQLEKAPAASDPRAIERAVLAERKAGDAARAPILKALGRATNILLSMSAALAEEGERARAVHEGGQSSGAEIGVPAARPEIGVRRDEAATGVQPVARRPIATPSPRAVRAVPVDGVSTGMQKILNALAELRALGIPQPRRAQLALFASMSLNGGSGAQNVANLVCMGLAEIPESGVVALTDAGEAAADAVNTPTSLDELHARVMAKLSTGQQKILAHLLEVYPDVITRHALSEAVGMSLNGGSGAQNVADLVTVGAARIPAKGKVAASDLLFPEGLT